MEHFEQYGEPESEDDDDDVIQFDDVDWDEDKNLYNQGKHGVSFEEAATCFFDLERRLLDSPNSKGGEPRMLLYGTSDAGRPLVVVFVVRLTDDMTIARIISARRLS